MLAGALGAGIGIVGLSAAGNEPLAVKGLCTVARQKIYQNMIISVHLDDMSVLKNRKMMVSHLMRK